MGDYTSRGRQMMEKADKKLSSWSMFGNKYEDAAELIEKACNQFKLGKSWQDGGRAYEKLADVQIKLDSVHEAASAYVEAAKCYQKTSKTDVLRALHKAVEYYTAMGRLSMAAKNLREVGETLEKEGKKQDSVEFFRQAADLYAGEEQISEANKSRLKVAQFTAELGQYAEAIGIYEDVARRSADSPLLKYSAKGYLLNAGICQLCTSDPMGVKMAVERYEDIDLNFQGSREGNLLKALTEAFEGADVDSFTDAIAEFDQMTKLDPWKVTLLLRAKKRIESRDEVDEEDFT